MFMSPDSLAMKSHKEAPRTVVCPKAEKNIVAVLPKQRLFENTKVLKESYHFNDELLSFPSR